MSSARPARTPILKIVRERWVAIVLFIVTVTFVAQNRTRVPINLFWIDLRAPLWIVFAVLLAIGVVIGLIIARRRSSHL